ncbi:TPA: YraN family protein, partial [Serratia marcescens]
MNPRASGAGYELLARRHLEHAGLTFCAANVAVRGGEL